MIREATPADEAAIVRLNRESEHFLSPLDRPRLRRLREAAAVCRVVQDDAEVLAFLLAFRERADYDSPNYRWFDAALASFLYIDRVVVAGSHRGRGLGAMLYDDVFRIARDMGVAQVTCEFDVEPPNAVSQRFHSRFGFREVGSQWVAGGAKRVSLQAAATS